MNRAIDAWYNDRAWFQGLQKRIMEQVCVCVWGGGGAERGGWRGVWDGRGGTLGCAPSSSGCISKSAAPLRAEGDPSMDPSMEKVITSVETRAAGSGHRV